MSNVRRDDDSVQPDADRTSSPWDQSSSFGSMLQEVAQASEYELATALSQAPATPPASLGPYRIIGILGRGGMGVVYRAAHGETGEPAAVKTVRVADESLLEGIRREIHVLAGIRHPGVVRILDEGVQEGLPWYAMELLEGVTLRRYCQPGFQQQTLSLAEPWWTQSLCDGSGPGPGGSMLFNPLAAASGTTLDSTSGGGPPLQSLLTLVRHICGALAFLHGEGIVHRDLKPENILIVAASGAQRAARSTSDSSSLRAAPPLSSVAASSLQLAAPWPVLMDFGLVSRFGGEVSREAFELGRATGGTVAYMAPEQARGELVDARADLYSLGCILYELVTGRPPFVGSSPVQVLQQHLEAEPIAPSRLLGGSGLRAGSRVPQELDALLLRLLAKRPRDRLGHARDLASALARLGASDGLDVAAPQPRAYLYRPDFAGREDALGQIERHLARLKSGAGGVVLVGGESGVGKTRLILEAALRAESRGLRVLSGECLAPGVPEVGVATSAAGSSLHPLRRALRVVADRCRERGRSETERLLGRRGKVLALYEPTLAALPGQAAYPEPEDLPPSASRLRLFGDLVETFVAIAADRPLLLVLDDLQWADAVTLEFLEFLLRSGHLEQQRLLVLGTYRSEELGSVLQRLIELPRVDSIDLKRLGEAAVQAMVGDMLALAPPPPVLARFLARQSEGNPFFVAEYLRLAVEEGVFFRDEEGRWQVEGGESASQATGALYEDLPLPGSIRALVSRRLEGLPSEAAELAAASAVLGREVPATLLAAMMPLSEELRLHALAELLRRQVVEEAGPARFRFVHDKIREVAYGRIPDAGRQILHHAAARAIEEVYSDQRGEHLGALAQHWEAAGQSARARECYLQGARWALERSSFEEAVSLARQSKRLGGAAAAALLLAESLTELAQNYEALDEAREVVRLPEATEEERAAARVRILLVLEQQDDAAGVLLQVEEVLRSNPSDLFRRKALLARATALHRLGRYDEAFAEAARALELARSMNDAAGVATVLSRTGNIHSERGAYAEALACFQEALAIERSLGRRRAVAGILSNIGVAQWFRGSYGEAQAHYEEALAMYREMGHRAGIASNLSNLGLLRYGHGAYAEALALLSEALPIQNETGNRQAVALGLNNIGCVHLERGELEEALNVLRRAQAVLREIDSPMLESLTLHSLGNSHAALGRFDEAEQAFAEGIRIAEAHGLTKFLAENLLARARARLEYKPLEGREDARRAVVLWSDLQNPLREGAALATVARYQSLEGHHAAARENVTRAFHLVPVESDFNLYLQVVEDDAALRLATGDREGAELTARQAAERARSSGALTALLRIERILHATERRSPIGQPGSGG